MRMCMCCGLNPNEAQTDEQIEWEENYIIQNGKCSACDLRESDE